jgi:hypothetical protein
MAHRLTKLERLAEGRFPWVALIEANREFCAQRGLSLSRFGHSVVWQKEWYQVFRFGREGDAETFMREFGGERIQ